MQPTLQQIGGAGSHRLRSVRRDRTNDSRAACCLRRSEGPPCEHLNPDQDGQEACQRADAQAPRRHNSCESANASLAKELGLPLPRLPPRKHYDLIGSPENSQPNTGANSCQSCLCPEGTAWLLLRTERRRLHSAGVLWQQHQSTGCQACAGSAGMLPCQRETKSYPQRSCGMLLPGHDAKEVPCHVHTVLRPTTCCDRGALCMSDLVAWNTR
mmetsp:Transcript_66287/g.156038  ORF Transcript_66287/g.156038 Transcript_66287/m.156038 type:complete len:213 (-) Transcript_66287:1870-2508(-)